MTDEGMPPELAAVLREHSPQVFISGPMLIPHAASPTGWLLVVPEVASDQ